MGRDVVVKEQFRMIGRVEKILQVPHRCLTCNQLWCQVALETPNFLDHVCERAWLYSSELASLNHLVDGDRAGHMIAFEIDARDVEVPFAVVQERIRSVTCHRYGS